MRYWYKTMIRQPDAIQRYLDLIKKTVSHSLWDDPGMPLETIIYKISPALRPLVRAVAALLGLFHFRLVRHVTVTPRERELGLIWPSVAETMIGARRLDNIQFCVENVLSEKVPGDLIETGAWRGGACILMRAILAAYNVVDRRVFVADSFEGLPTPNEDKYQHDRGDRHYTFQNLAVSKETVVENFRKYGLLDEQVVFLKGWFKDTLPVAPIQKLAVMRLDGDMYESTMDALVNLYHKLSPGGYCIIDDYSLAGCKRAVEDFRAHNRITEQIIDIDCMGSYWRKK
jgi:O-methyltransferase